MKQIEHHKQKPEGKLRRFWNNRSYSFKATTYGFAGTAIPFALAAAAEICIPGGSIIAAKIANAFLVTAPASFYLAIREAHRNHPQLSQALGRENASFITWSAAVGVGLPHWYVGSMPPSALEAVKMSANTNLPDYMRLPISGMLFVVACVFIPTIAFKIKKRTEEFLRNEFRFRRTISGDQIGRAHV